MKSSDFKQWRKSLGLSQKQAAQALGLKRRIVQYYEKGERDGVRIEVPKSVRLACFALTNGIVDYHGPGSKPVDVETESDAEKPAKPARKRKQAETAAR